jgi:PAS domain-containing protein
MALLVHGSHPSRKIGLIIAALGPALVLTYMFFGHSIVRALYQSDLSLAHGIMKARQVTPLEAYLLAADSAIVDIGWSLVAIGLLVWLFFKNQLGLAVCGLSSFAGTLALFSVLNSVPILVRALHFDILPYFSTRMNRVPDDILGSREKPFNRYQTDSFRGSAYSPIYGIDVQPTSVRWETDDNGFRNGRDSSGADIAVIGNSFGEYGSDLDKTFPRQLELKLGGPRVVNLTKGGYGPFAYLEVLRRYAVAKNVRYVLILCYSASDADQLGYWLRTGNTHAFEPSVQSGFFARYRMAVSQTGAMFYSINKAALQMALRRMDSSAFVHPDVAVLRLPQGPRREIVFMGGHSPRSATDLLNSPEWEAWQRILVATRELSEDHSMVPVLVYIPAATEVYAQYSTEESGALWLRTRNDLIASRHSNEEAARMLAANAGIPMISVLPAFEEAARDGKLVYYPLDSHWTDEGAEIAASVVAETLKFMLFDTPAAAPIDIPGRLFANGNGQLSVFERTLDGRIKSWNRQAEELYGWTRDEAIGKVSHQLLRTQFPEPLEQINDSVLQKGRWEGMLVHATRDGRRVEVMSQWSWDPKTHLGDIIEINKRSPSF